jgi:hypothetical protein
MVGLGVSCPEGLAELTDCGPALSKAWAVGKRWPNIHALTELQSSKASNAVG